MYAKAVRETLPHAELLIDRFHLVKKAEEVVDTVRRRVIRPQRDRRGRKSDVEWINRRRPLRGAETLTDEQRTELSTKLLAGRPREEFTAAWITKDLRRDLLPAPPAVGCATRSPPARYRFSRFLAAGTHRTERSPLSGPPHPGLDGRHGAVSRW